MPSAWFASSAPQGRSAGVLLSFVDLFQFGTAFRDYLASRLAVSGQRDDPYPRELVNARVRPS
jgi:hypothetical protein